MRVASSKFLLNIFAAISPDGEINYMIPEGRGTAEIFCEFLEKRVRETGRKIFAVMDSCSAQEAKRAKQWIAEHAEDCEIFYQPAYSPEVNPVELTWALVKREVSQQVSKTKGQMRTSLENAFRALEESLEQVRAFSREADCKYILV